MNLVLSQRLHRKGAKYAKGRFFVQSGESDWTKIKLSLRALRLCGEYRFSIKEEG